MAASQVSNVNRREFFRVPLLTTPLPAQAVFPSVQEEVPLLTLNFSATGAKFLTSVTPPSTTTSFYFDIAFENFHFRELGRVIWVDSKELVLFGRKVVLYECGFFFTHKDLKTVQQRQVFSQFLERSSKNSQLAAWFLNNKHLLNRFLFLSYVKLNQTA